MNGKKVIYSEAAYLIGLITLAFGTALMEKADFGMSMVVAPAYLVYLKISETVPWFTFGMAEYCLQAVLLILTAIVLRRFKVTYLFSLVTAVIYGLILDACIGLAGVLPLSHMVGRISYYLIGMVFCSYGVSMLFHTYFAPEAYELLVKEISAEYHFGISKTKTVYDCTSCLIALIMSFCFYGFGHFEGVKYGTIFCALVNGWLIGRCSRFTEQHAAFRDAFRKKQVQSEEMKF